MTPNKSNNLIFLLHSTHSGTVLFSSYMRDLGISIDLQQYYVKSGWLRRIGKGVYVPFDGKPSLQGALFSLQTMNNSDIHIGGESALRLHGYQHYVTMDPQSRAEQLFLEQPVKLASWFTPDILGSAFTAYHSVITTDDGLVDFHYLDYSFRISTPERAIIEYFSLCPAKGSLDIAFNLLEMLVSLQPDLLQKLLKHTDSVKTKRLFLFFSDLIGHDWLEKINQEDLYLGRGKRVIEPGGIYNPKYQISLGAYGIVQ